MRIVFFFLGGDVKRITVVALMLAGCSKNPSKTLVRAHHSATDPDNQCRNAEEAAQASALEGNQPKEQTVSFGDLATPERQELASLADQADFFGCVSSTNDATPDARTYTVGLTIDGRSREIRLAEPIRDPAMAKLLSVVRRLSKQHATAR